MRRVAALQLLLLAGSGICAGQERFEVASVKHAGNSDPAGHPAALRGGPGTAEPERITYHNQPLIRFIAAAYGVDFDQISGPGWMGSENYDVDARVPLGTTQQQLKLMWQGLLADRFRLKAHVIEKEFPAYELSVTAKGSKLHRSGDQEYKPKPGFPAVPAGAKRGLSFGPSGNVLQTFQDTSIPEFSQLLGWPLASLGGSGGMTIGRIIDKTGLEGTYDFTFEFAGTFGPGGAFPAALPDGEIRTPLMFEALRDQLGLKLEQKKTLLDVVVVDSVEKIPTQN